MEMSAANATRGLRRLLLLPLLAVGLSLPGEAPAREPVPAKIDTSYRLPMIKVTRVTRPWAYERLSAANDLLAEARYEEALAKLREMEGSKKVNEYESALMKQTFSSPIE